MRFYPFISRILMKFENYVHNLHAEDPIFRAGEDGSILDLRQLPERMRKDRKGLFSPRMVTYMVDSIAYSASGKILHLSLIDMNGNPRLDRYLDLLSWDVVDL
jgi:hypothetical protein